MTYVGGGSPTPAKASYVIDGGAYYTATNVEDALSEIYESLTAGSPWWTLAVSGVMKEPTGVQNTAESTISFVDGTLTFTIAPTGANFDYYIQGLKYTSTGDTVVITDTEGTWFIYYAGAVLTASQVAWDIGAANACPIGILYWDATNNTAIFVCDERHGTVMDAATHSWIHDTVGMRYESGGALTEGAGAHEGKIALDSINLHDEDLEVPVVNGTTGAAQWEQTLGNGTTTWAAIPVFYRSGAAGVWRRYATTVYPYYDNGGAERINFNQYSAGTWTSTALPANNRYTSYWIFGTSNNLEPIISIMGQGNISVSLADARDENDFDDLTLGSLPIPEMKVLYRLIYKSNAAGLGSPTLEDVTDYRVVAQIAPSNSNAQDHASLAGLSADDHIQYLLDNGSRDILSGTILDMYWTAATTLTGATVGAHIDMVTNLTPNAQNMTALEITMPTTGAGFDYGIYLTGAGSLIKIDSTGTGSEHVIDITPSASLVAGADWVGIDIDMGGLDPATGLGATAHGVTVTAFSMASVDHDTTTYGYYFRAPPSDPSYGFYHRLTELSAFAACRGFMSYADDVLSATATYTGLHIDWDDITRDGGAPVLEGVKVLLPADYTNFGTTFAGQFTGDGRSVLICDTTYALDVSGAMRLNGIVTAINSITLDIGASIDEFSIDGTLAGNSDTALPTEQAVKTYVDTVAALRAPLADVLVIGNESDGTDLLLDEASDLIMYSDDVTTMTVTLDGGAGLLDMNPLGTGSQNIIVITPTQPLDAGSTWIGIYEDLTALDPATGAACAIYGIELDASGIVSTDKDANVIGMNFSPPLQDASFEIYHSLGKMALDKQQTVLKSYNAGALPSTATYRGIHLDWDALTSAGGAIAPIMRGVIVEMPVDYTNFGIATYAAWFSGDAREVQVCNTTYALEVTGAMLFNGVITGVNSIALDVGATIDEFSTDGTMAGNSDTALPTEAAVVTYVATQLATTDTLAEVLAIGNESDGTNMLLDSASDLIMYSDNKVTDTITLDGGAGLIDLNPLGAGSQKIIDITPTTSLQAASLWYGTYQNLGALDPATGVGAHVYGHYVDMTSLVSVDRDVTAKGYCFIGPQDDSSVAFYSLVSELVDNHKFTVFKTYHIQTLSKTATYQGLHIDWDQLTRDAEAPVVEGIRVEIAPNLTDFGVSFAGYFSGDGRSVTICDTTYALDVAGTTRISGDGTITGTFGVGGLLTADGVVPEADLWDDLGSSDLTWANLYVRDILDAAGNQIIGTDGAAKIDALAIISCAVTMETTLNVGGLTTVDGLVPETDLVDDLGTADLTWQSLFVRYIKDDDGTTCAHTNSDGDFYIDADLHIGGNDIKDSGGNVVMSFDGAGNVDIIGAITYATIHVTDLELEGDDIKDSGSNVVISFDGAGKIDGLANISAAVIIENTLSAGTGTFAVDANGYITTYPDMAVGTDNYVLTYDHALGTLVLEASGGGAHALTTHSDVSLADPDADRIVFWDDSDSQFEFLVANTGLAIDGNNLNCSITQYTDALARTAVVSDAAYAAGWDTVTTYAPSKNAVYDKIAAMDILIAANTTTAEVEAIIDAEIVNGQSIDNAIDSLITTHTAIAAAHHTRFTIAEVEDVITDELVNGQSIDNRIDALISAAHTLSDAYTLDMLMYGSDNATWVPCVPEDRGDFITSSGTYIPLATGTKYLIMNLPLPTTKGTLKLYLTGIMSCLFDADATDYLSQVVVLGVKYDGPYTALQTDNTDRTAQGQFTFSFGAIDCSSYERIQIQCSFVVATTSDLDVTSILARVYYSA